MCLPSDRSGLPHILQYGQDNPDGPWETRLQFLFNNDLHNRLHSAGGGYVPLPDSGGGVHSAHDTYLYHS